MVVEKEVCFHEQIKNKVVVDIRIATYNINKYKNKEKKKEKKRKKKKKKKK